MQQQQQQQPSKRRIVIILGLWGILLTWLFWSFVRMGTWSGTGGARDDKKDEPTSMKPVAVEDDAARRIVEGQIAVAAGRREKFLGDVKDAERALDSWEDELRRWTKDVEEGLLASDKGKVLSTEPALSQFRTLYDRQADRPDEYRIKTLRQALVAYARPVKRAHESGQSAAVPNEELEKGVADVLGQATTAGRAQKLAREEILRLVVGKPTVAGAQPLGQAIEAQKRERAAREAARLADDRAKEDERAEAARRAQEAEQLKRENEQKLELEKEQAAQREKVREKELEEVRRETGARAAAAEELAAKKDKLAKAKTAARAWLSDVPADDTPYMRKMMSNSTGFFYAHHAHMDKNGIQSAADAWRERDKACEKTLGCSLFALYKWKKAGWSLDGPPAD